MGKSISDSVRNKPKRFIPNTNSRGNCSRMTSPFPSPHLQSPGPRKVQGSQLRGFLSSQLSGMDHKSVTPEVKEDVLEEFDDTNAAIYPSIDAKGLQQMHASSSRYCPAAANSIQCNGIDGNHSKPYLV